MKYKLILFISLFLLTCSDAPINKLDKNKRFNGKITYNISYPYNQQDPYLNLYPTKLKATINDTTIHTVINDIGININTYFNFEKHEVDQFVEIAFPYHKLHVHLSEKDILNYNNKLPKYKFQTTDEKDSIGPCKITKVLASSENSSEILELWTTEDIDIIDVNFVGPFGKLNKSLLQFEASNIGFRTKIRAKKIEPCEVNIKTMLAKSDYKTVPMDSLEYIIANLFSIQD